MGLRYEVCRDFDGVLRQPAALDLTMGVFWNFSIIVRNHYPTL
jgi:hypothetical protein